MNKENAQGKFISIIQTDHRHENYERTKAVASFAYSTSTGDNLDDLITSVRKRENADQKKQRIDITKALTPVSVEMIKKYFRKIRKTDGVKVESKWQNENNNAKEQLDSTLSDFYARQGVEEYLFDTLESWTFSDPNCFLVVERENIVENNVVTGVRIYPTVFKSENIRDYGMKYGVLDYLLVEEVMKEKTRSASKDISEFRMYGSGWVLHAVEYIDEKPKLESYQELNIAIDNTSKNRTFLFYIYDNGTTEVPAIRLGAYLDGQTESSTAVTPLEPVKPLLEQLINIGSLHDLTMFLHSIPRRKELVETCDYQYEDSVCENGWVSSTEVCPSCKGTGDKSITSEQDWIRIRLPENFRPDDIPDLAKMAHTEPSDTDLLRWQQEKLDWLLKFIVYATMTKDAVTMAEISRTATEMVLNNQEAYDKIQPYAELYSQAYMLIARVTTQYQETSDGFVVSHQFPDDYQFETEKELLAKLKEARETSAPYDYVARLSAQLIRRQTRSSEEAERAKAWEKWKPWPDMSDEMLSLVLADRSPQDRDRMLRENFFRIRTEIEQETSGNFYLLPYNAQEERINNKIQELTQSIQFRTVEPVDFEI